MATTNPQQRRTHAAKVVLSQLYATWVTSESGMTEIEKAIEEIMSLQQKGRKTNGSPPNESSNATNRHSAEPQQQRKPDDAQNNYHSDPNATPVQATPRRSSSPQPTSPGNARRRQGDDVPRSPSPVHKTRLYGVDELDFSHRVGSPGGTTTASPGGIHHVKPVVDPMAPVPHLSSSTGVTNNNISGVSNNSNVNVASIQPTTHFLSPGSLDVSVTSVVVPNESFASIETSVAGSSMPSQRVVHLSGNFASLPPENVERATLNDIPVFYSGKDRKGGRKSLVETEEHALRNFFALKGSAVNRKVAKGAVAPIDASKTVRKGQFGKLCQDVFGVPTWLKDALFRRIALTSGVSESTALTYEQISTFYYNVFGPLSINRRLFELLRNDSRSEHLTLQNLKDATRYLVDSHPGLEFLKQPEFQEYYCRTVAIRIVYSLERQQCGFISWYDFDRSDLPEVMQEVDEKDVNVVLQYFSYEHFYVLYCKFWELDTDRDQLVGFDDMCKYGQGAICPSVIKRIVEGAGRPLKSGKPGKLDFEDFVYFCLSEEDKNSRSAVYYWFKVLDVDGDGILSGYELYEFFQENQQRFLEYFECPESDLSYPDMMCQMMDMLGFSHVSEEKFGLKLSDLHSCATPANFFNMVFNAHKFMLFEHRDPFLEHQQKVRPEKTEWDRFARAEYDRMASEA
ncbi:hypothetical protein, conserved [Trypanosoma brucei gambiense DAL972]|uniref:EF-hand domain-containing protein n=2 Tax=Trypanosoma brucei TaxID=5691 RepID=C9ZZ28_TRYB9|nr:hypothetical protein, conserved [Trypanosoma brucei gambiense DAL972]RHW70486.1 hypothetical protein DPX39_090073000 [Trypanosoma brucei equiperdum]CBH14677.1 hypothetical protein, conserved [Trypanosoma brucei gambiense DAL972]|eukprot:XP_011776943.1 hypothetical protein, conserved [Trypanosoma brucei gambiense DAL972]